MLYLMRFLGQPRSEEEMDDVHQLVMESLVNFCNDPSTKQSVLLYPFIHLLLFLFLYFYFILFYFILFYFVLFCFVLFCFVLFCFVLFCFVLFCFVLFCFVLFCFVLFCFVLILKRYEGELLHLVLLETVASESVTNVLSTLAHS